MQEDRRRYGGNYDALSYRPKVEFSVRETLNGKSKEQEAFELFAPLYGLAAKHYQTTLTIQNEEWQLIGSRLKRSRFPIACRRTDDAKVALFTEAVIAPLKDSEPGGVS